MKFTPRERLNEAREPRSGEDLAHVTHEYVRLSRRPNVGLFALFWRIITDEQQGRTIFRRKTIKDQDIHQLCADITVHTSSRRSLHLLDS